MREIKFRAWHPPITQKGIGFMQIDPFITDGGINEQFEWGNKNNIVFMQFTGLLDKNGKEIYEGDIVRLGKLNVGVLYQPPSFIMKQKNKSGWSDRWFTFDLYYKDPQFCEVIGNVWENGDLLK